LSKLFSGSHKELGGLGVKGKLGKKEGTSGGRVTSESSQSGSPKPLGIWKFFKTGTRLEGKKKIRAGQRFEIERGEFPSLRTMETPVENRPKLPVSGILR